MADPKRKRLLVLSLSVAVWGAASLAAVPARGCTAASPRAADRSTPHSEDSATGNPRASRISADRLEQGEAPETDGLPNIVVILVDDLGYGETGAQGNPQIPTPNIDSIAAHGVRFTNGYVTASYCAPSRAGLLTGRYQTRFGFEGNPVGAGNEEPGVGLPASEVTLAHRLREAGYATGLVGKWHLGGTAPFHPLRRGFDEFFGFLHEGHFFVPPPYEGVVSFLRRRTLPSGAEDGAWVSPGGELILSTHMPHDEPPYDANNPMLRGGQPVVEEAYLTDAFSREAACFVRRHAGRPFFLYVAYSAVHSPMQAKREDMARFAEIDDPHRRVFAGMVGALDDGVGAILAALREEGIEDDTLVFFLSDNGGPTRELTSSNAPLRGGKGSLYEGGVRVPFFIRWGDRLPAAATFDPPVSSLDIMPTALAAAGAGVPGTPPLDGVDLLPYLTGDRRRRPHETLYWRMGARAALRHHDWKVIRPGSNPQEGWELYDLSEDPGESRNLAPQRPEILRDLVARWHTLDEAMADPRF